MRDLLTETVNDLLSGAAGSDTVYDAALWARLTELGLAGVAVPEEAGGAGGTLADAAVVARACGYHAAVVPYADHALLAAPLLAAAGIAVPDGPLTVAFAPRGFALGDDATGSGTLPRVPWGRDAAGVVVIADGGGEGARVALLDPAHARVTAGENTAGEPRDDLTVDAAPVTVAAVPGADVRDLRARAALARAVAMTGAARRVLDLTVRYANERVQFGRPIGRFQAVQQELAEMAGAVEQAEAMADQAVTLATGTTGTAGTAGTAGTVDAVDAVDADVVRAAAGAAKVCAGRAARVAVTWGHQVHGAIGFTQEHALHHVTRRLLAWRDEYGAEAVWCAELGGLVAAGGADGMWRLLTSGGVHA